METCPKCGSESGESPQEFVIRKVQEDLGFAAGPWQDGEPPKDGEWYLAMFRGRPAAITWNEGFKRWEDNASLWFSEVPDKHAAINLPSAE